MPLFINIFIWKCQSRAFPIKYIHVPIIKYIQKVFISQQYFCLASIFHMYWDTDRFSFFSLLCSMCQSHDTVFHTGNATNIWCAMCQSATLCLKIPVPKHSINISTRTFPWESADKYYMIRAEKQKQSWADVKVLQRGITMRQDHNSRYQVLLISL